VRTWRASGKTSELESLLLEYKTHLTICKIVSYFSCICLTNWWILGYSKEFFRQSRITAEAGIFSMARLSPELKLYMRGWIFWGKPRGSNRRMHYAWTDQHPFYDFRRNAFNDSMIKENRSLHITT
jgi:hypothetical protein